MKVSDYWRARGAWKKEKKASPNSQQHTGEMRNNWLHLNKVPIVHASATSSLFSPYFLHAQDVPPRRIALPIPVSRVS